MISAIESAAGKCNAAIYQLTVVLLGSRQPVWRQLQVPGDASLDWLHAVLQVAIGWTNSTKLRNVKINIDILRCPVEFRAAGD